MPDAGLAQATQSAQGDCAREANRRGYQVVKTGGFRQFQDGWQLELTLRNAQGRTDDGICTVRTTTGQVSFTGFDFGGSGDGDGMRFDCQSDGYKYRECQLPVDGRARLVRQYSRPTATGGVCQEGYSWGQRGDRVWVDRGCRAQFEVVRGDTGGGGAGPSPILERVEASCRAEAQRQFIAVLNVTPARSQGSYWQATVYGKLRGHPVAADCRYDPRTNRSSLFIGQGGGAGGGTDLKVRVETACMAHAKRVGYQVVGQRAASAVQNGFNVGLTLKQGNALYQASCFYDTRSGETRLEQLRPQPR